MANQDRKHNAGNASPAGDPLNPAAPTRRNFLKSLGASGIAAASGNAFAQVAADASRKAVDASAASAAGAAHTIRLTVNGKPHTLQVAANAVLLDVMREQLQLTGTKKGCDQGQCGACTLHVNGVAINSCLSLAVMHDGDEITTIEGLERNGELHPVQQAFWEHDAFQCGYCTPGQMMSAVAILKDPHVGADDASVREAMSGNICRCGAYKNILAAIQSARGKTKGAA
ncbi:MAG TPA: (2Fe-2S)-binding protein [Oxalicibacterium sp.]|nr:(2Fe-2S)-binding protein [Oxalicibacterium sp.]